MSFEVLLYPAVVLVFLTSSALLVIRDWRWSIATLAVQYLGVFVFVGLQGYLVVALAKLLAGWAAGVVLSLALGGGPSTEIGRDTADRGSHIAVSRTASSGRLFRLLAVGIVGLAVASVASPLAAWLPDIRVEQAWGALLLIGLGLLHLGLTNQPFNVVVGLLTVLSGFEVLYSTVEVSALVTGLLAGVNLGLALTGGYLFLAPTIAEGE